MALHNVPFKVHIYFFIYKKKCKSLTKHTPARALSGMMIFLSDYSALNADISFKMKYFGYSIPSNRSTWHRLKSSAGKLTIKGHRVFGS